MRARADADRLRGARRKFSLRNFTTFRQSTYRVYCAVSLENGVLILEFLKFYVAAFCGSMFRKTAGLARLCGDMALKYATWRCGTPF